MSSNVRIEVNGRGILELLKSGEIAGELEGRMQAALAAAKASAPVDSGAYRASLRLWTEMHPSRVAVHVGADVPYAMVVEANHNTLSGALDAAGGRA